MVGTQPSFDLPTLAAARPFEIARADKHDVRASSFGAVGRCCQHSLDNLARFAEKSLRCPVSSFRLLHESGLCERPRYQKLVPVVPACLQTFPCRNLSLAVPAFHNQCLGDLDICLANKVLPVHLLRFRDSFSQAIDCRRLLPQSFFKFS